MKSLFYRIMSIIAGLALLMDGLALVNFLFHPLAGDYNFNSSLYRAVIVLAIIPLTLLVGFFVIKRVPGNVVGPLLIMWTGSLAYSAMPVEIGPVPFALYYAYDMIFGWFGLFLMLLHFPDGKIHPPGAARFIYSLLPLNFIDNSLIFLSTQPLQIPSRMENVLSLPGLMPFALLLLIASLLLLMPMLLLTPVSFVLRYRHGSLRERQQIKWLALFGGLLVLYTFLIGIIYPLLIGGEVMNPGRYLFGMTFYLSNGLFPPLAIGFSVLRYRLWDIDRIIRRTLTYSILTVILALIYLSSVVVIQTILGFFFHLGIGDFAIVVSTLAIAAAFTPLRRRIQRVIDQRFYRRRYDLDQTIASFAATARSEVVLEPLASALLQNIEETLQPQDLSLWLISGRKG